MSFRFFIEHSLRDFCVPACLGSVIHHALQLKTAPVNSGESLPSALTSSKADTSLEEAEYVIVDGGLTGCVVASQIAQSDPRLQLVLVETGIDASSDPLIKNIGGAFAVAGSHFDYKYKTNRVHTYSYGWGSTWRQHFEFWSLASKGCERFRPVSQIGR